MQEQRAHHDRHAEHDETSLCGCLDMSRRDQTWKLYSKVVSWKKTELTQAMIWETIFHTRVSTS